MIVDKFDIINIKYFTFDRPITYINHLFYHRCTVNLIHTYWVIPFFLAYILNIHINHTNFILNCYTVTPVSSTNRYRIKAGNFGHIIYNRIIMLILLWTNMPIFDINYINRHLFTITVKMSFYYDWACPIYCDSEPVHVTNTVNGMLLLSWQRTFSCLVLL